VSLSVFIFYVEGDDMYDYECFGMCSVSYGVDFALYVFGGECI